MAGRRRADRIGPHTSREALWAAMRRLGRFTVRQVTDETRLGLDTARDYVRGLELAGYLKRAGIAEGTGQGVARRAVVYELVRDVGVEAPRVRKDGTEVTQGRGREQMWRTMKVLGEFSARDLAIHASTEEHSVSLKEAKHYIRYLVKAGYLAVVRTTGLAWRYRLLPSKNTGPRAPMIQRVRQVFDPNLGRVIWRSGDGG